MKVSLGMVAAAAAALVIADGAAAQQVGTAAAVNPAAQARGAGGSRTIVIGQSIAHRERIQTTSAGSVQLLFIDKTSMTIGPNSDLAIDEYVFDPNTNTGKMAATLTKGVMRFVGGQVSHTGNAQITTPTAVVGIRGGVGIIGTNQVYIGYGEGQVTSGSSSVTLGAGEFTRTSGGGTPPTPPAAPPPGLIAQLLGNFQSQGGQGGGAPASSTRVTEARTTATGTSTGTIATTTTAAANVQQTAQATTSQSATQQQTTQITQTVSTTAQTTVATERAEEIIEAEIVTRRLFGATAFAFSMTNCCSISSPTSNAPYLPASFATGTTRYISPVMGYRLASEDVANRAPYFQWGVDITGTGPSQSSWFFVMTGALVEDTTGGFAFSSGFAGTRRGAGNLSMGRASGAMSSTPGSVVLDNSRLPTSADVWQQDYVATTQTYRNIDAGFFPGGPVPFAPYTFTQRVTRIDTPSTLGADRPAETLTGFTGGMMRTISFPAGGGNGTFIAPAVPLFGYAQIQLSPSLNRLQADFFVGNVGTTGPADNFSVGHFQMGALDRSLRSRSAYVDYNNFAAREAVVVNNAGTEFQQLSSVNGQSLNNQNTFMANVPRHVAQQAAPTTTFCQCDYTRWGFWSNDSRRAGPNGTTLGDWGHMMTWVAGRLPNIDEVPSQGSATYTGHVVASIVNNAGAEYIASGNLSNTINFGSRTGTGSVSNLDGTNYAGPLALQHDDPRNLTGVLAGNNNNRQMLMIGNLFRGRTSPVGEMGGSVLINQTAGGTYRGSGIFAGRAP